MDEFNAIVQVAGNLTTIGALLLWLRAERSDNRELWGIVRDLIRLRLRQVEEHVDTIPVIDNARPMSFDTTETTR